MKLHVRGSGSPILLCHGIGAAQASWGEFAETLSESHTVITFDAPGCGDAPARWVPYTMRSLAADVARKVRERFGMVHVAGLSWGGVLAQQLAADHPSLVDRLVLVSTSAGVGGVMPAPHVTLLASTPLRYVWPRFGEWVAPILYGAGGGKVNSAAPSMVGYAHQLAAVATWQGCGAIAAPTLVVCGEDDRLTPVGNAHVLGERIPNSRVVTIPDAGHLWLLNEPVAAATLVTVHTTSNQENAA
ncbi:alpha/beta hydrolase [Rhodococcus ruber]|uniref:alpha/beta fold hydrolase n=1 Tax=Rhodococcus ruber TaxID=1830 RepID=UPI0022B3FA38|nr:alpha/beta hydrolase [Rhodococcus ruber]MCZ4506399.1 alpha/beta hydrolase [Rhodococcus ruber]